MIPILRRDLTVRSTWSLSQYIPPKELGGTNQSAIITVASSANSLLLQMHVVILLLDS